jgi:uncharacterized membrane protein YkvA (DUF1232 family)
MKIVQHFVAGLSGLVSLVYLLNPTAGFIEFIPDNIPIFGNLDEAAATAILIAALAYFGLDVTRLFGKASVNAAEEYTKKHGDGIIEAETVKESAES